MPPHLCLNIFIHMPLKKLYFLLIYTLLTLTISTHSVRAGHRCKCLFITYSYRRPHPDNLLSLYVAVLCFCGE